MKKKKKLKNIIWIMLLIIFGAIFIFSVYEILMWEKDNQETNKVINDIMSNVKIDEVEDNINTEVINPPAKKTGDYWTYIETPLINVNFNELKTKNTDTVAWLKVNGTNINYPVVQTNNNADYLNKAFNGKANKAGWIFMDYRNDVNNLSYNTIIYGHARVNNTMFGTLNKILESKWLNNPENFLIHLSTETENTLWQVFSVYETEIETYYITTSFSDESFLNFLDTIKKRSIYNFDAELNSNDKVLTLSTCTNNSTGRIVLHAKLIKKEAK